jgi:adenosine kinase
MAAGGGGGLHGSGSLKGAILGMGNPLLDISATVPVSFLDKCVSRARARARCRVCERWAAGRVQGRGGARRYDLKLNNAVLADEKHSGLTADLVSSFPVQYIAGGATMNSIRTAQWMTGETGATTYVGCVGEDENGERMEQAAMGDGVRVLFRKESSVPTGTCAVLVHEKERSLVASLGAANHYKLDHFETAAVQDAVAAARVIYSAGFFLTVSPDSMVRCGQAVAASRDKFYATNLSAPFLCSVFKDAMMRVLPYADFVFGNESEAKAFGEVHGVAGGSVQDVALYIAALPKARGLFSRTVVITQGSAPTIVVDNGVLHEFPVPPLRDEEIVDFNGAGDAFVGGFLAATIRGCTLPKRIEAGNFAAQTIIKVSGCVLPRSCDYKW